MILGLLALALADPPEAIAIQAIKASEWRRDGPDAVAAAGDSDAEEVLRERIRALGRLRDAGSLKHLRPHVSHPSEAVRREVAFALGLTPGGAAPLRTWLAREAPPEERITVQYGVRWQIVEALGRIGERRDAPLLVAELTRGWPYDDAAARGLLRMHRRGVDVTAQRSAIVDALLDDPDPRTEITLAQGIARIGLGDLAPDTLDRLEWRAMAAPTSMARAMIVRALLGSDDEALEARVLRFALVDTPLVRATALQHGSVDAEQVARALSEPTGFWVWQAATEAAPDALPPPDALWRQAHRVRVDPSYSPSGDSWPTRAALLGREQGIDALVDLAVEGRRHPAIRTAAAARLHELEAGRDVYLKLLASPDPGVRSAGLEWLEGPPDPGIIEEIVLTIRVEKDGEVLRSGLERLAAFREARRSSVTATRFLTSTLKRAATRRNPALQRLARSMAADLGVELPEPPKEVAVRELILPDGTVTTTTGDLPKWLEVLQDDRAIVSTNRGAFVIRLDPRVAPLAVYNFASLARSGFYRDLYWHRVVPGFVAQGGCPRGDGWGDPGWTIVDEVSDRPFEVGAVGMARGPRDTGGSQFFVMTGPGRFLDGDYTWFGTVIEGQEVLRELEPGDRIRDVRIERRSPDE